MLNLKRKGMQDAIEANGHTFLLNTDFRIWLEFPERINAMSEGDFSGYDGLFLEPSPAPTQEVIEALGAFFHEKKEVPRSEGSSDTLDYDIDADYIYAAFMQGYGIDLMEEDLHWHKFLALLAALPDDTALSKIIGYRQYDGKDKDVCKKKQDWALPLRLMEADKAAMEEFDNLFG